MCVMSECGEQLLRLSDLSGFNDQLCFKFVDGAVAHVGDLSEF